MFRINTVEYGWETNVTPQSGSVTYTTPTKRVYIPETGSRTFLSVVAEMYLRDANTGTSISNMTNAGMSCSIDANLRGTAPASVGSINFFSEHASMVWNQTFTDQFQALFTGSNHGVSFSWINAQANSGVWVGHSFRLVCTYQYDDANVGTNIKTIRLPLESVVGWMSTTASVFGSSAPGYTNIPALDTFLPEASKVYRDIYITYDGINATTSTASVQMVTNIDSGSDSVRYEQRARMITDVVYFDIQNVSGTMDTATAHTLSARSTVTSRMGYVAPTLYATYEYAGANSTNIISNLILPIENFYGIYNAVFPIISGNATFLIPERTVSPLLNSAIIVYTGATSLHNRTVSVNGANVAPPMHSVLRGTAASGYSQTHYRFDPAAVSSSGFVAVPGFNKLQVSVINQAVSLMSLSAYALLTYSASKLDSHENHNKIICFSSGSFGSTASSTTLNKADRFPTASIHPDVTASYYMHDPVSIFSGNGVAASFVGISMNITGSSAVTSSIGTNISFIGAGSSTITHRRYAHVLPNTYGNHNGDRNKPTTYFARNPTLLVNQAGAITNRWNSDYITYNQNIYRITGSLENCNHSSTDYNVSIFSSGSNSPLTPLYRLVSSGSGSTKYFMFDWYENITKLYAVSTYPENGVSNCVTASNGTILTIDFGNSVGATPHAYTFIG